MMNIWCDPNFKQIEWKLLKQTWVTQRHPWYRAEKLPSKVTFQAWECGVNVWDFRISKSFVFFWSRDPLVSPSTENVAAVAVCNARVNGDATTRSTWRQDESSWRWSNGIFMSSETCRNQVGHCEHTFESVAMLTCMIMVSQQLRRSSNRTFLSLILQSRGIFDLWSFCSHAFRLEIVERAWGNHEMSRDPDKMREIHMETTKIELNTVTTENSHGP